MVNEIILSSLHHTTLKQKSMASHEYKSRSNRQYALGGIKRYQVVTHIFRNNKLQLTDMLILLSAELWNYDLHLSSKTTIIFFKTRSYYPMISQHVSYTIRTLSLEVSKLTV